MITYRWEWTPRKSHRAIATYSLIIINIIIYIISSISKLFTSISDEYIDTYAYIPVLMYEPRQWYRVVTSMFLHGDIFHIFFNMLFLFWFGKELEELLGVKKFLVLYLVSGIASIFFHTGFIPVMGVLNLVIPAIGASGAISGLLGAYLMIYPRRRLNICWLLYFIPLCFTTTAATFLLFWFATQVIYGYLRFGGIAFFAHVGGFIAGIFLIYILKKRSSIEKLFIIPSLEIYRATGLGRITKTILTILLLLVLGGSLYSALRAHQASNIYIIDITACESNICYSDQGIYTPMKDEVIAPSKDVPRIAFNRLIWSGIIMNKSNANSYMYLRLDKIVKLPDYNVWVYVNIRGNGIYDENGILIQFNGTILTEVVKMGILGPIGKEKEIKRIDTSLHAQDVARDTGEMVVRPLALVSLTFTLSSIMVVVYRDQDIVEEDLLYIPTYIPWT